MATPIRVPDVGTTVDQVELVAWLVDEGARVERGDAIAEIETDKATAELESAAEGVLLKHVVPAGSAVQTGDVLAYVGKAGEEVPAAPSEPADEEEPEAGTPPSPARREPTSPVVRNLAKRLGVRLEDCRGTGRNGVITREDVLRASRTGEAEPAGGGEPLGPRQAAVARAVTESTQTIPHLRVEAEVDMTAVENLRLDAESEEARPSYDAMFVKAMAGALSAVPLIGARLRDDRVVPPSGFHVAVAIGVGDDLFLPVVRDADQKTMGAIHEEIRELAAKARAGALRLEEMSGGCIALSNLGMYAIRAFDAIVHPDHSAILSVGRTEMRARVVEGGTLQVRPTAVIRLAVDHRLINGRAAAQYVSKVKEILESGRLE